MASWIETIVREFGAFGVALLMFLENVFPPIPSELIMPLAGYAAAKGEGSLLLIILGGALGSLAGAFFWYVIGRVIGEDRLKSFAARHGRWLTLSDDDVDAAQKWFERHGRVAVLVGRLVPTIRTLISVPAGFARMPLAQFLAYSAIGTALWVTLLAGLGAWLGQNYAAVEKWLGPVSTGIVVLLVLTYIYRVVTFKKRAEPWASEEKPDARIPLRRD